MIEAFTVINETANRDKVIAAIDAQKAKLPADKKDDAAMVQQATIAGAMPVLNTLLGATITKYGFAPGMGASRAARSRHHCSTPPPPSKRARTSLAAPSGRVTRYIAHRSRRCSQA